MMNGCGAMPKYVPGAYDSDDCITLTDEGECVPSKWPALADELAAWDVEAMVDSASGGEGNRQDVPSAGRELANR